MTKSRRSFLKLAALTSGAVLSPEANPQITSERPPTQRPASKNNDVSAPSYLADLVNVLQGTDSTPLFSRGNTLPIVAMPFGMAHWTLQTTSERGPWFFDPRERRIEGIRCTHQLSPWLGDYGTVTLLPFTGSPDVDAAARASSYQPEHLHLTPYRMHLEELRYRIAVDLVPTERCAIMRLTFDVSGPAGLIISIPGKDATCVQGLSDGTFDVTSRENKGGVAPNFATYYAFRVDARSPTLSLKELSQERVGVVGFTVENGQTVHVRIGTSFISAEQARLNLNSEIGGNSFEALSKLGAEKWEEQLGRVRVAGEDTLQIRIFYSSLYRASLFPRIWHETDSSGKTVHRSPYSGEILEGVMYADHGFWDVYRAWYPMMSLLYPDRLAEILQAWVNASKEGGWIPQFPCPGYKGAMSGSPSDSIFGDAAAKGIKGFDLETAYIALRRHATETTKPGAGYGRKGVADYLHFGYLPEDRHDASLTETLDAAYGDFCIAQVARALHHEDDARMFEKRSQNWRNVFDPSTSFLRPRLSNGSWTANFDPIRWGGGYVEGSAWQYRFSVPHDPEGLIQNMGGSKAYVDALDLMLATPPHFHVGSYKSEIHEMSEMAAVNFGQYAHSNQPSHHILYMFAIAGRRDRTQYWVRRVLNELYTIDSYAGDADTGAMAAWFVLSSLGFYSLCPGRPSYVLGSPLFEEAHLSLIGSKKISILAVNQKRDHPFVESCTVNGKAFNETSIPHQTLANGAQLIFKMRG
jgi:predicted alpha-1,2-mannosidase